MGFFIRFMVKGREFCYFKDVELKLVRRTV